MEFPHSLQRAKLRNEKCQWILIKLSAILDLDTKEKKVFILNAKYILLQWYIT